jgi:hypothetical protein
VMAALTPVVSLLMVDCHSPTPKPVWRRYGAWAAHLYDESFGEPKQFCKVKHGLFFGPKERTLVEASLTPVGTPYGRVCQWCLREWNRQRKQRLALEKVSVEDVVTSSQGVSEEELCCSQNAYDERRTVALLGFVRAVRRARHSEEFRVSTTEAWRQKQKDPLMRSMGFIIGTCMAARADDAWIAAYDFAMIRWG